MTMTITERKPQIYALIQAHLDPTPVEELTITERNFPHRVRADLQRAVDRVICRRRQCLVLLRGQEGARLRRDQPHRAARQEPPEPL